MTSRPPSDPARRICVVANRKSGGNAGSRAAIDKALAVFGPEAWLAEWSPGDALAALVDAQIEKGASLVVAAGGDGTVMALADAMLGRDVPLAVLPLGTFNYFARGLGSSEDVEEAARQILAGRAHPISVGQVNGQVFLNNASLGIYPAILRERETVYRRWGRRRLAAHWSVVKTFLRFQRPMRLTLVADGTASQRRTALVFVARSAFQLDAFGIEGGEAIHDDAFAVLVARAEGRRALFALTWRLVTRSPRRGRDYDLLSARELVIESPRKRLLLAFDGEKRRESAPFHFAMSTDKLRIILPPASATAP